LSDEEGSKVGDFGGEVGSVREKVIDGREKESFRGPESLLSEREELGDGGGGKEESGEERCAGSEERWIKEIQDDTSRELKR